MHMIFRPAYPLRKSIEPLNRAAKVFMQAFSPSNINYWMPMFRRKYDVIVKA